MQVKATVWTFTLDVTRPSRLSPFSRVRQDVWGPAMVSLLSRNLPTIPLTYCVSVTFFLSVTWILSWRVSSHLKKINLPGIFLLDFQVLFYECHIAAIIQILYIPWNLSHASRCISENNTKNYVSASNISESGDRAKHTMSTVETHHDNQNVFMNTQACQNSAQGLSYLMPLHELDRRFYIYLSVPPSLTDNLRIFRYVPLPSQTQSWFLAWVWKLEQMLNLLLWEMWHST